MASRVNTLMSVGLFVLSGVPLCRPVPAVCPVALKSVVVDVNCAENVRPVWLCVPPPPAVGMLALSVAL